MNKEIIVRDKKVFYRLFGKGQPVLLIHGFGEQGDVWQCQVDFLKDEFLLIVPDLPGSGRSDMVEDMSMEGLAEIVKLIIDAEALGLPLVMIGHSMGGYITLAFAKKFPEYLKAFGLFHSTAYADSEEKKATRKKGIEFINKNGAFTFLQSTTPNLFSAFTKEQRPELIDEFIRGLNNFSAPALVSYYEAMMDRQDTTDLLKTTSLPVLFVIGEHDNAIPFQDSLTLTHLPEKSYIHILHQSGHMGMLEETTKSNTILKEFLRDMNRP
ncbi:alpha/beta fold hydrolase [Terrimonas pollutisoli]|uniref:alpha/beta fold hydrolase n=1 Tax=Terrimonas pollutisoli TaxID=3034147 RepID=UPI0023EAC6F3|nr:alpha/beta hydrolase [Terrimonas sp. H1YJ31]